MEKLKEWSLQPVSLISIFLFSVVVVVFLLGHRYSVHIHYSFKNFKIQQGSTTLKSECQNWKERESALQRKDSRPTEQPNFLFVSGSQTSWLSDAGSLFHMSFMKCISISAIFWWLFFFLIQCCLFFCEFSLRRDLWT